MEMRLIFAAMAGSLIGLVSPAAAQTYPSKPIHIYVPYAPGGVADIAARLVGAKLTDAWGQQVVVENRTGGNGFIAVSAAAKAPADGYVLLVGTVGEFTINPSLFKDIPYDMQRDLTPVAMLSDTPIVLAANANTPYKSVAEVLAAGKAQPGRISVASPGNGTMNHLAIEWITLQSGAKFQHIPYRGGAPAAAALAGGDIPLGVLAISSVAPHVKSNRMRVLALTTAKRSPFYPDWSTLQENGVAEVNASNWVAMYAPKGTPQAVVDKLNTEINKILAMQDIKDRFATGGAVTLPMTTAELEARQKKDAATFKVLVEKSGVKPD